MREKGTVKAFARGFGFIIPDAGGKDLFVHYSAIQVRGYKHLEPGQRVEFTIGAGLRGPVAEDVVILDESAKMVERAERAAEM